MGLGFRVLGFGVGAATTSILVHIQSITNIDVVQLSSLLLVRVVVLVVVVVVVAAVAAVAAVAIVGTGGLGGFGLRISGLGLVAIRVGLTRLGVLLSPAIAA